MDDARAVEFYRSILDAMPVMVFVVDAELVVRDMNAAARKMLNKNATLLHRLRGGEVLDCLHRQDHPSGCGRGPACQSCVIRDSVNKSAKGEVVTRRRTKATLVQLDESRRDVDLHITTTPFSMAEEHLVLLTIEDITEITLLQHIIPICMHCKKIRDDDRYWHNVERYFESHLGAEFSHGICPECMKRHYPSAAGRNKTKE
jgi:PAS domain-containing protein